MMFAEKQFSKYAFVDASPNIAFIKYWGKLNVDPQDTLKSNWALNPSLSMTLSKAKTRTLFAIEKNHGDTKKLWLQGEAASEQDIKKISQHVTRVCQAFDLEEPQGWYFESQNNFPMATGIASSASAFAALTWAVLGALKGEEWTQKTFNETPRRLSEICRWGSGSACRSVDGPYMLWENEAASKIDFRTKLYDTVLILSKTKKSVSSRDGHLAAMNSPKLSMRLENIKSRLAQMTTALQDNAFDEFGRLLEEEALEMHEVAQSGPSPIDYFLPETRELLKKIQSLQSRDFYFTMDAGPNIHVISQRNVRDDLNELLKSLSIEAEIWEDESGKGPRFIELNDQFRQQSQL